MLGTANLRGPTLHRRKKRDSYGVRCDVELGDQTAVQPLQDHRGVKVAAFQSHRASSTLSILRCSNLLFSAFTFLLPAMEGAGILHLFQSKWRMEVASCPNIDRRTRSQGETLVLYWQLYGRAGPASWQLKYPNMCPR